MPNKISIIQSQTINALRFPMAMAVVFIHSGLQATTEYDAHKTMLGNVLVFIINSILPAAVPMFFMISGFLFTCKMEKLSRVWYNKQIHKKCLTLLVPYICWNILAIPVYVLLFHDKAILGIIENLRLLDFFNLFWAYNGSYPLDLPLWFIRDLFILMVASPVIIWILKKAKLVFVLIVSLFYVIIEKQICGFSSVGLLFFSLGAYYGLKDEKNILNFGDKYKLLLGILFLSIGFAHLYYPNVLFFSRIYTILLTMVIYKFVYCCVSKKYISPKPLLAKSSFFIFASHFLGIYGYSTAIIRLTLPFEYLFSNDMKIIFSVILCTCICVILYYILQRYFPKVAYVLTGGRN